MFKEDGQRRQRQMWQNLN